MKMNYRRETKNTVIYDADQENSPVQTVYVEKAWLRANGLVSAPDLFSKHIKLEVTPCTE